MIIPAVEAVEGRVGGVRDVGPAARVIFSSANRHPQARETGRSFPQSKQSKAASAAVGPGCPRAGLPFGVAPPFLPALLRPGLLRRPRRGRIHGRGGRDRDRRRPHPPRLRRVCEDRRRCRLPARPMYSRRLTQTRFGWSLPRHEGDRLNAIAATKAAPSTHFRQAKGRSNWRSPVARRWRVHRPHAARRSSRVAADGGPVGGCSIGRAARGERPDAKEGAHPAQFWKGGEAFAAKAVERADCGQI